ncbi:MAG: TonB-dependent receptor, partial [Acidobacteria bacterium]|nr:TonB-dependent receptor [Acidobacteriota bacterium]
HYFDLGVNWKASKSILVLGGINNLMDKEPPLGAGMSNNDYGPGFYGTYDPYGRYLHIGVQFTF